MEWLDWWLQASAVLQVSFAAPSCLLLLRLGLSSRRRARRIGAAALSLVNGALALEACLFLWQAPAREEISGPVLVTLLLVRAVMALSALVIGALVLGAARA